jgi:hypothetical protein
MAIADVALFSPSKIPPYPAQTMYRRMVHHWTPLVSDKMLLVRVFAAITHDLESVITHESV